jgi:serine/threonine protein kinase
VDQRHLGSRRTLHAFGWETVVGTVETLARRGDPAELSPVLDGLNAFEAHREVVGLLDRLVVLLRGELRNRAVLLLERKRLGLGLERVAALFREIRSPYQIQKVLGQGLFTETYLARDEATGLEVVVRVLRPEFAAQPHVRARFFDLSNQSVHLVHEKLALTREVRAFPEHHIYFAVRDFVPGVTLQRVLEAGKRFEPVPVIRILHDVSQALAPIHRKGICHGGIKPSNIFLGERDRVVLGDPSLPVQGIGVALDRLAYDYRYAPPETFLSGGTLGPAADFYALGCVAYELSCGQPPFVSDNFHELAACHLHDAVVPPSQRGAQMGFGWDEVVLKLLARVPAERYGAFIAWETAGPGPAVDDESLDDERLYSVDDESFLYDERLYSLDNRPLLRDLENYQVGQSVVGFESTGVPLTGSDDAPTSAPADPELPPKLPGYKILGVLGRGGMGTVYRAEQTSLKRPVVLKTVPLSRWAGSELLTRFRQEALLMARLKHPNIVQIIDVLESEGHAILVMELVEGGTLDRKALQRPLPVREGARMVATLARAVHYAHEQGVLHRDVKPSNILLTPEGGPKITDFGLAKPLDSDVSMTGHGEILGTPTYMAPEQARGDLDMIGRATDVYCLGGVLYFLLAGRPPFQGSSKLDVLRRVAEERPVPPRRFRPDTPKELEAICLKCLEKAPQRRYQTAAALADDLEHWLRGELLTARGPGICQRLARFFSFRRTAKPPLESQGPGN